MKLMIVGSDRIYSIENFYVKYLREAGVEVNHFPAQRFFYDYYQSGIVSKILFRLGLSGILKNINRKFIKEVQQFQPSVILVFKGMELFPASLSRAKKLGIRLVNFNADNPFLFSGRGSGNSNVSKAIGLYDLHITYNAAVKKEMEARFRIPTRLLPFGYEIEEKLYLECCQQDEILRICFLGNPDEYRGKFLQELANRGLPLDLYGNNWESFIKHHAVNIFEPVYADDCWKVLRRYRVQLNLMRPHNPDSHNMRTFELGGIGAIQLAAATADHRYYFTEGKEIFTFSNIHECEKIALELLKMGMDEAEEIRLNTRNRSEADGYSYKARSAELLEMLKTESGEI